MGVVDEIEHMPVDGELRPGGKPPADPGVPRRTPGEHVAGGGPRTGLHAGVHIVGVEDALRELTHHA
ncbi:hypothetical protein [Microbispora sp. NPDC049125]|uniref:hypothetical protein n=1 Tax=Microbispora sp. NPDC049125 TaxID=3154929 RepID=UPI0034662A57